MKHPVTSGNDSSSGFPTKSADGGEVYSIELTSHRKLTGKFFMIRKEADGKQTG